MLVESDTGIGILQTKHSNKRQKKLHDQSRQTLITIQQTLVTVLQPLQNENNPNTIKLDHNTSEC